MRYKREDREEGEAGGGGADVVQQVAYELIIPPHLAIHTSRVESVESDTKHTQDVRPETLGASDPAVLLLAPVTGWGGEMGRDGMGWDGVGWGGVWWDVMRWSGMKWSGIRSGGWNGMR